jgi:glutamate racemase
MKIGFFDSGLGGLTILKATRELIPQYQYVFFGDTAHVPYGGKSEAEIHELTWKGIETLFDAGAVLVIVACNSASAESLRKIQDSTLKEKYPDRRILGVIIPTVEILVERVSNRVLLIGTERTINSKKYERELSKIENTITLHTRATPTLVPKIEIGDIDGAVAEAQKVIDEMSGEVDTIVLGCTHYTMLKDKLRAIYKEKIIISQDEIIPEKLKKYLDRHPEIESRLTHERGIEILLSAESPEYDLIKKDFLIV